MMLRAVWLLLMAVLAAGCVDGSSASSGAIRLLNAVPDGPRMNLLVDEDLRIAGVSFGGGSAFATDRAGDYRVRIEEVLPSSDSTANTDTIYDQLLDWAVNDEISLIVAGEAAAGTEEIIEIRNRTRGVPFGQTRVQFVNAAVGSPAVDVYVTAPGAVLTAAAPLAPALAYKAFTAQQDVAGGIARIAVTAVNDPSTVLFDSGTSFLPLEGSLLIAVVPNVGVGGSTSPFSLVIMTGTGSGIVPDKDTGADVRVVNAAPASYNLDVFINDVSVDNTSRQECDPLTAEPGTPLEFCATAFTSIGDFSFIAAGGYDVKIQQPGADAVAAQTLAGSFAAGTRSSLLLTGLTDDGATATTQGLLALAGARSIATTAQLRIVDASLAADAAVAGDPSTDRLELYITEPGVDIATEDPDFVNIRLGSDTGYLSLAGGGYQLTLAKSDTATPEAAPEVLFTQELLLSDGGLYTLVIADSVGGLQPLQSLSLEDDSTP